MTPRTDVAALYARLDEQSARLDTYRRHYLGVAPAAYLSTTSLEALDKRLKRLGTNYTRLVVSAVADRLRVTGFRREASTGADENTWSLYRRAGLIPGSELVHTDRALYGAAYVTVWGSDTDPRRPVAVLDSPLTAWADLDPATGDVRQAIRVWKENSPTDPKPATFATVLDPATIRVWRTVGDTPNSNPGTWTEIAAFDNPWGVTPMVAFVRRTSADDTQGTSVAADVLDLEDAIAKVLQDSMVTSEYYARPRRWATGLEIVEDETGQPIDPFGEARLLQSEDPQTKFGQLEPARLDGYADMIGALTQQIGSVTGLPAHYLGLYGDQPPNPETVRAMEAQLTSRAFTDQRQLDQPWGQVAALLHGVAQPDLPLPDDIIPTWASPEIRTPAQSTDAAQKLHAMGVPLQVLLVDYLGFDPQTAERITTMQQSELLQRAVVAAANTRTGTLLP